MLRAAAALSRSPATSSLNSSRRYSPSLEVAFRIAAAFRELLEQVFQWSPERPEEQILIQ